ncbi:hypothetical protein [Aerosakkonema funiforme]|uniref:hypothetical protein n=1 Tax=Aerosakkonema funiforme TaxID=1246630 RepID=UPI0035BA8B54
MTFDFPDAVHLRTNAQINPVSLKSCAFGNYKCTQKLANKLGFDRIFCAWQLKVYAATRFLTFSDIAVMTIAISTVSGLYENLIKFGFI